MCLLLYCFTPAPKTDQAETFMQISCPDAPQWRCACQAVHLTLGEAHRITSMVAPTVESSEDGRQRDRWLVRGPTFGRGGGQRARPSASCSKTKLGQRFFLRSSTGISQRCQPHIRTHVDDRISSAPDGAQRMRRAPDETRRPFCSCNKTRML
jgi:hypothetical protein